MGTLLIAMVSSHLQILQYSDESIRGPRVDREDLIKYENEATRLRVDCTIISDPRAT